MKNKNIALLFLVASFTFTGCLKEDVNNAIGIPNEEVSIYVLRNTYKNADITISKNSVGGASIIRGTVISRPENSNFPAGYIAIESEWRGQIRGILVKVDNPAMYTFGDMVRVNIDGATLSRQPGAMAIIGVPSGGITKEGTGSSRTHRPVSISTLESNPDLYESTLISITADVDPEPPLNEPFKGVKKLLDGEGKTIELITADNATFANEKIAPSASFHGILLKENNRITLRMQQASDMMYPSGKLYTGWPETFESPYQTKTSYNVTATGNLVTMPSGEWYLLQSIQGITAGRDRIVSGAQAIRFQQNLTTPAYLQMNFDVPNGASKVTFWYGAYYTDRSSSFQLEYSTDGGATWVQTGNIISDAHSTAVSLVAKQAVFLMDIQGPVRFRIHKLGLGTSNNNISNGRLGVDDFAIYKSY